MPAVDIEFYILRYSPDEHVAMRPYSAITVKSKDKGSPVVRKDRESRCWSPVSRQTAREWRTGKSSIHKGTPGGGCQYCGGTVTLPVAGRLRLFVGTYLCCSETEACVKNLPKVDTWKRNGRGLNPRSVSRKVQRSNCYTTSLTLGLL